MRRLLILTLALAITGATAILALAQFADEGPFVEMGQPHPAGRAPLGERLAAWFQSKRG